MTAYILGSTGIGHTMRCELDKPLTTGVLWVRTWCGHEVEIPADRLTRTAPDVLCPNCAAGIREAERARNEITRIRSALADQTPMDTYEIEE